MKTLLRRCAGLDVHKVEIVACLRLVEKGKVARRVRCFPNLGYHVEISATT